MTRWYGKSNESVYGRCGIGSHANGEDYGVVEWVKRNTLRCFGHIERMESDKFMKKVYMSENGGPNIKGRPPRRWRDRVKEYMCERGASRGEGWIKQGRSVWRGRGGDFSAVATSMGDIPRGSEVSEL